MPRALKGMGPSRNQPHSLSFQWRRRRADARSLLLRAMQRDRCGSAATVAASTPATAASTAGRGTITTAAGRRRAAGSCSAASAEATAATASAASSIPEEAGRNPVRKFAAERDGVVVGEVRGPVHVEIDDVVRAY